MWSRVVQSSLKTVNSRGVISLRMLKRFQDEVNEERQCQSQKERTKQGHGHGVTPGFGIRGRGMGEALLRHCLAVATDLGYRTCYLETLTGMDQAMKLYGRLGFQPLCAPLGRTGHGGCDRWYARTLP